MAEREGQGSSKSVHNSLQHTKEQEDIKGEATVVTDSEPMREELVQSAIVFLKHPKVVASSNVQRRSFLENKGLSVDEIDEAFRRLLSLPSNSVNSDTCTPQGVSDHSCTTTRQEAEIDTERVDVSETPNPETVTPVLPRHPKSYMEVMEMIQRGERPDDIQDINDEPPNPDQPISEPRMAPKPKPWEKQGQESPSWDLKAHPSDSIELRSEVHNDSTDQATGSNSSSNHGDLSLMVEPVTGSEAPTDDAASPKQ
ncbi:peroxisomal membrane protein PEX14 isoform X1 [Brachypodium distachyon]|uniref:peroxisomal membrane protein PEX14 isoform X1 n=1 Tax=Brachypodium distachyon TaxID=15368 RepID=UPI00052FFD5B|nr:peroxisomal membrane protein PEX14 isoform X1 [Brachypodium distachyon]|eukprot:XP_010230993.1 peroxisomal membrane protein PEX14 isoform X1 [Brachypodium distachyon]